MRVYTCDEISNLVDGIVLYWDNNKSIERFSSYPNCPLFRSLYFIKNHINNKDNLISRLETYKVSGIIIDNCDLIDLKNLSSKGIGVILVKNLNKSYEDIVQLYRKQFDIPFVQVIGSSGKTTTKEMLGSILRTKLNTLVSFENLNSPSGVAYNLLKLTAKHQAAVLETGMRSKGVISRSTSIIQPDYVIVTCIHRAHLVTVGSLENIIKAKSEFIGFLSPESLVIINGDDENCKKLPLDQYQGKVLTFGMSKSCDIWAKEIQYDDFKMHFKACTRNLEIDCTINTIGIYNVLNALAAIILSLNLGFSKQEIQEGLLQFKPMYNRLQVVKRNKNFCIINDTFNANPDSTIALVEEIQNFAQGKPIILVLGDFENPNYQDTEYPESVHYEVGKKAASAMLYRLIAIGKWADSLIKGAVDNGYPIKNTGCFTKPEYAIDFLKQSIVKNNIIIFKSSVHTNLTVLINSISGEDYD